MITSMRGRDKFAKFKRLILILSRLFGLLPLSSRKKLLEHYRMTNGYKGVLLRYALLKSIAIKCGDNVLIQSGVYLLCPENLLILNNVSIHPMCYIDATGCIEIGNDVSIAHGTTIMSSTHIFNNPNIPIKDQGIQNEPTIIKNNVWIGAKVTILSGIVIESGSIIAANSVITKDVPENTIMAGIAARSIRQR